MAALEFERRRTIRADTPILSEGPLRPFVAGKHIVRIDRDASNTIGASPETSESVVLAYRLLQDIPDYRRALQAWFERIEVGGSLVVVVPHAFLHTRKLTLPSPWRKEQRRLYTPSSLLAEVEEALVPNSYRVRWSGDLDDDYDYDRDAELEPIGRSDVALVLERIAPPVWSLGAPISMPDAVPPEMMDFTFEPERTRIETDERPVIRRVLIMKLDHLGDLIMSLPALERMRRYFAGATIDLLVGSWNASMARDLRVANRVIAFDAFPRNSSEEEPDVAATLGKFRSLVVDDYDLAIDLRTDVDTRILLGSVNAALKAGIGTRARFPFLDIALPLDDTRNEAERVRDERIGPHGFALQGSGRRSHFALYSDKRTVERDCAIIWGPYLELDPGEYIFDFYIDLEDRRGDGLLRLDIALDRGKTVSEMIVSGPDKFHLPFRVVKPKTIFEARISTIEGHPSISFGFHGGRLIKKGPGNVLHQTEYACLMVELAKLRILDLGLAVETASA